MSRRKPKFELFPARRQDIGDPISRIEWHWRLRSGNGEIVAHGEGYTSETDARRGVLTVQALVLESPTITVVANEPDSNTD